MCLCLVFVCCWLTVARPQRQDQFDPCRARPQCRLARAVDREYNLAVPLGVALAERQPAQRSFVNCVCYYFKILIQQVREHDGAVVKTIGDAVMATFLVSKDAIEALFDVQTAFAAFNAREQTRDDIIIKIGAHRGPCIAVTSNDRLDYFGRTVNVASRVQGLSSGRDIVFSRSFYDEPEVRGVVDGSGWQISHFAVRLRGIDDLYDVVHLLPVEDSST